MLQPCRKEKDKRDLKRTKDPWRSHAKSCTEMDDKVMSKKLGLDVRKEHASSIGTISQIWNTTIIRSEERL